MLKTEQYCITRENIYCHEIIGLKAKVVNSPDTNKIGLKGRIVDETKNTFVIQSKQTEKVLPKKETELEVLLGKEKVRLDGKMLLFRPEDRTKKILKRKRLWG